MNRLSYALAMLITALGSHWLFGFDPQVASESSRATGEAWVVDTQDEWTEGLQKKDGLEISDGMATPTATKAELQSVLKTYPEKKTASSITISQSPIWQNWQPTQRIGPSNLGDAPVLLSMGPDNYWIFGRYQPFKAKKKNGGAPPTFEATEAKLDGFDIPLKTTPFANQYDAPGGLQPRLGGYHAWQSRDMENWVHHGPVSDKQGKWMTTAELADGKVYFYYDFPNDQDPHLIIDSDLTDGKIGQKMGLAFKDPSDGSDCAIIRDLDGKFHLILENWDPIKASARSWDSPLASHAVSEDGISGFQLVDPAVDYRTKPTGKKANYKHPHWKNEDPENFPTNVAEYEIHEPEQAAYGDWAAISIDGQYYLFGDYDPVGAHGKQNMSVAWFTSSDINKPFKFCGHVGKGHPDPDIMFAKNQFFLATQTEQDFVSPGPWVDGVELRVGVDTTKDGSVDQWTDWQAVRETYDTIPGFAKQVAKSPAKLDLSSLPAGYGFQFEVRLTDNTENESKPILDQVQLDFK